MRIYLFILSLFFCSISFAQNTISGTVTDAKNQPVTGANVKVVGSSEATSTGFDGKFLLKVKNELPLTLQVSMMGFNPQTIEVASKDQEVLVVLDEQSTSLNEIVVSASRTPERILESPVTIERMGVKEVKNTTAPSFYEGLENLKDVHFNTSSFNFKSVNTRGFATVANTRFMQLVDGMDNSSPALNFVLGNLLGVSDLDVSSVEILPGASSALYGANAFNGIMFMNSKNPFNKEGVSTYFKYGMTSQKAAGENPFRDFGFRAAKKFSDHFAGKINFTYLGATEWIADDRRSLTLGGEGHNVNQNYDGLNLYGDEVTTFIPGVGQVSRTGYAERDLNDSKIENTKFDASIHVRPWAKSDSKFVKNIEFIGQYKVGIGNTVYQGANRYALQDFFMDQIKFEVKADNFFVRAYRTSEDAGNSYDMRFAAWNINRAAKSDTEWFTNYATAYFLSSSVLGSLPNAAALHARDYADNNVKPAGLAFLPTPAGLARFAPGSAQFNTALTRIKGDPSLITGSKFQDQSKIHHTDVNYNFKDQVKFAEIQVGGSGRRYTMDSNGTIFTDDPNQPLTYDEYGLYTQVQKKLMDDKIKLTGSIRYDKSQNFDGNFSPRISATYSAGTKKQHNFRVSFQTGFRNPTTQDQYIGLDLGPFALIGSAADNLARFNETRTVSTTGQTTYGQPASISLSGVDAYAKSYSLASVQALGVSGNPADLKVAEIGLVKPEQVQAFELGYRTIVEKMSVDISGYYNVYKNFISQERVVTPYYGFGTPLAAAAIGAGDRRIYQIYTNSTADVSSYGVGLGINRKIAGFDLGASYNYSGFEFDRDSDPDFIPGFNTPKHRAKGSFGHEKLFKNFGFNTNVRYNSEYLWESTFIDATVPENIVFDAQINYAIPYLKSIIKVGGANLFGGDYIQVPGAGAIGQQYYASWTINP